MQEEVLVLLALRAQALLKAELEVKRFLVQQEASLLREQEWKG